MNRLLLTLLFAGLLLPAVPALYAATVNLVPNPGFEDSTPGDTMPSAWKPANPGSAVQVTWEKEGHSGNHSLSLSLSDTIRWSQMWIHGNPFTVKPGTMYKLSFWYKTIGPGSAEVQVTGAKCVLSEGFGGAAAWTKWEKTVLFPQDFTKPHLAFILYNRSGLKYWVDDVSMEEMPLEQQPAYTGYDELKKRIQFFQRLATRLPKGHWLETQLAEIDAKYTVVKKDFSVWMELAQKEPDNPEVSKKGLALTAAIADIKTKMEGGGFTVWAPTADMQPDPLALPPVADDIKQIALRAGQVETVPGRFLVTNTTDQTLGLHLKVAGSFALYSTRFVTPAVRKASLLEFRRMNGINELVVLPGMTREIRVLPSEPRLKIGAVKGSVMFLAMNRKLPQKQVALTMDVFSEAWKKPDWAVESTGMEKAPSSEGRTGDYAVWTKSPWLPARASDQPPKPEEERKFRSVMTLHDRQPAALFITNTTSSWLSFSVSADDLVKKIPGLKVVLRGAPTPQIDDIIKANPASIGILDHYTGTNGVGHPLYLLNGFNEIAVPPQETREVWIDMTTTSTPPGTYRASVAIQPGTPGIAGKSVEMELKVENLQLPDRGPLEVYLWDYAQTETAFQDMVDHKVTRFMGTDLPEITKGKDGTFTVSTKLWERLPVKAKYGKFVGSYGMIAAFEQWAKNNKVEHMGPEYRRVLKDAVRELVRQYKSLGLDYADFPIQSSDEAQGGTADTIAEVGKIIRETDPKLQMALTGVATKEEMEKMAPYTDVWIPHMGGVMNKAAMWKEFYGAQQSQGKRVWSYSCSCPPRGEPAVEYFRAQAWRVWKLNFTGMCFFAWSYIVTENDAGETVPCRTWEALREGIDDYQHLWLLSGEIKNAEKKGLPAERIGAAKSVLDKAVDKILPGETLWRNGGSMAYDMEDARESLADEIVKLREEMAKK